MNRSRWAALGAAVAVTVGSGGLMPASASVDTGDKPVLVSITPCRLVDTRPAPETVGPRNGALNANETYSFLVRGTNGNCTIPADAVAVVVNLAAVFPTANSFFTLFPADAPRPLAANLNFVSGQAPVSNGATIKLSADGRMSIYNLFGTVHFTLDIVGYFSHHTTGTTDIQDAAVTGAKVADAAIATAKLADNAVTSAKLADNAVSSAKIVDATIASGDLADNAVTTGKIANDAVTTAKVADNAVTAAKIPDFPGVGGLLNDDLGIYFAEVNANGTLANSSNPGVVTSTRFGVGQYEVDFNRPVKECAPVVTEGLADSPLIPVGGIPGVTDRAGKTDAFFIQMRNNAGGVADRAFHIIVVC